VQIWPTIMKLETHQWIVHDDNTHLSRCICNTSGGHMCHSMNTSITRTCCLGFLFNRTRRREDMFEGLDA
jgi:hypothetical protein